MPRRRGTGHGLDVTGYALYCYTMNEYEFDEANGERTPMIARKFLRFSRICSICLLPNGMVSAYITPRAEVVELVDTLS